MLDPHRGGRKLGAARLRYVVGIAAVAVAALAVATGALAKGDPWAATYTGGSASGGVVKFGTETLGAKHFVFGLKLKRIPVDCSGKAGPPHDSSNGQVDVRLKIKGEGFHYQATASNAHLESTLTFDGMLTEGRSQAAGTLRIHGDLVPVNNSQTTARPCDSGVLHWTAKRK
jgi:hypothetical protein